MRTPLAVVVGVLFTLVLVVVNTTPLRDWLLDASRPPSPAATTETMIQQPAGRILPFRDSVTAAEFRQLETGMTYRQAVAIIGFEGEEMSRLELAGTTTVMY